jgi:hypothetical protein
LGWSQSGGQVRAVPVAPLSADGQPVSRMRTGAVAVTINTVSSTRPGSHSRKEPTSIAERERIETS